MHSFIKSFQVGGADDVYRRYLREGRGEKMKKKNGHMESERERKKVKKREGGKKMGNDVSALGQLPRLLIKNADERGGEDDREARNMPGGSREINRARWISKLGRPGPRWDMDTFRLEASAC